MQLGLVDYLILVVYTLFVLGIGFALKRSTKTSTDFFLSGRAIPAWICGLAFISAGARWGQPDGQIMFLFILTMAAAEVCVGLALVLQLYSRFKTLDTDQASNMRG